MARMNYLELVDYLMDEYGMDEDTACREASAELYPDTYDANDYDGSECEIYDYSQDA